MVYRSLHHLWKTDGLHPSWLWPKGDKQKGCSGFSMPLQECSSLTEFNVQILAWSGVSPFLKSLQPTVINFTNGDNATAILQPISGGLPHD
jgi:hypothetical protein